MGWKAQVLGGIDRAFAVCVGLSVALCVLRDQLEPPPPAPQSVVDAIQAALQAEVDRIRQSSPGFTPSYEDAYGAYLVEQTGHSWYRVPPSATPGNIALDAQGKATARFAMEMAGRETRPRGIYG